MREPPSVVAYLAAGLLASCTFIAHATETKLGEAIQQNCTIDPPEPPQTFRFEFTLDGNDTASAFHLSQYFCNRAAYNTSEVWVLKGPYGDEQVVGFSVPQYAVEYKDPQKQEAVINITITGFASETEISNSDFDPATLTVSAFHKWRGIGDAASGGSWQFEKGRFVLKSYFVDASWDGEINPRTIVSYPVKTSRQIKQ